MAIKIIVDSASDFRIDEAEKLGITVIPLTITFGEENYMDGVDVTPIEFYEKLQRSKNLPKTSQINSFTFEQEFEKHVTNGDQVLVITISSKLSGTYNSAIQAAKNFDGKVKVVDSLSATVGEKILCKYAARLILEGKNLDEIVEILESAKNKIMLMGVVNTLEYLKKGGRISSAVAIAGSLLSVKPVLYIDDGEIKTLGKALGTKKAIAIMNNTANESEIDFDLPYEEFWSGTDKDILQKYETSPNMPFAGKTENMGVTALGASIGTHVGPNAVGLAFFKKD